MVDFYQIISTERITLEDAESRLVRFKNLLHLLEKTVARKKCYKEKKVEVFKNAKLLFEGQNLIYSGFIDNIFGKNLTGNRSGGEEMYSKNYDDDDDDDDDDDNEFYTPNKKPKDIMPDLESEESAEQRRKEKGQGLKLLTPELMLSRPPVSLAQLEAGNNSQKLNNEIRQLLYSLYR